MSKLLMGFVLALCLTTAVAASEAQSSRVGGLALSAGEWSSWESIGTGMSVSYSQVDKTTWTWRFRNDGTTTITFMDFNYRDKDGSHSDVLPVTLKPNAVFGGWASFTSSSKPTITPKKVTRSKPEEEAPADSARVHP